MKSTSQLSPVFEAFEVAQECFRLASATLVAERTRDKSADSFDGVEQRDPEVLLKEALEQTQGLAVVALWAVFERDLIEHVRSTVKWMSKGCPENYVQNLADKFECEAEFWRVGDILDLFKGEIDAHQIGRAKEIKRYRDWIAHKNPRRKAPTAFSPEDVYDHLVELWDQISEADHVAPGRPSSAGIGINGERDRDVAVPASHDRSPPSTRSRRPAERARSDDR